MKLNVPYKIVGEIDRSLTDSILNQISVEDWFVYDYRQAVTNMQDCDSILLRHSSEYRTATIRNMPLYEKFKGNLDRVLNFLRQYYDFDDHVSFIARLKPQGVVNAHTDNGEFLDQIHRLHIPLYTNEECFYVVDDTKINMQVGTVYEIDNQRTHAVYNNGDEYRIHLVVNLYPTKENT